MKPYPSTGARTLDARAAFFYVATGVTPAMVMRLPEVGSQYLFGIFDSKDRALRRRQDLQGHAAAEYPGGQVLVASRSTTTRPARCCRPRSVSRGREARASRAPRPTRTPDGSTTIYFGPKKPDGVNAGNFIETLPGKGWFVILRLYSPLESFFDKSWKPSDIEEVAG